MISKKYNYLNPLSENKSFVTDTAAARNDFSSSLALDKCYIVKLKPLLSIYYNGSDYRKVDA